MNDKTIKKACKMLDEYAQLIWFKGEDKTTEVLRKKYGNDIEVLSEKQQTEADIVFLPYEKKYHEILAIIKELES